MPRPYVILDVFTSRPLAGNPLAVVLDPSGLDDAAMQAIAREFNLSETVFVQPPDEPGHRASLRIFTPARELPFAGHPTVGTAVLLSLMDQSDAPFVLEEKVGLVSCRPRRGGEGRGEAVFDLPELPTHQGDLDIGAVAASLGFSRERIGAGEGGPALGPGRYSAGVPYAIVPLPDRATVDQAVQDPSRWQAAYGQGRQGAYLVAFDPVDPGHHLYARMISVGFGIPEDPATGSAAAALAGYLMAALDLPDGPNRFVIEQGYAMGRPSEIVLTLHVEAGALRRAEIAGTAIVVARGTLLA